MAESPSCGVEAETRGRSPPLNPGKVKIVPEASIVAPLKYAVGVLGVMAIATLPLIQLREISTFLIHVKCEMRCAIARGSTRANFCPGERSAIFRMVLCVSGVGAPLIAMEETEKMDDHAKR